MWRGIFGSLLVVSICMTTGPSAVADQPKPGERHPDFKLPSISDGKPVSLSDFRGKKVLLIQFASW